MQLPLEGHQMEGPVHNLRIAEAEDIAVVVAVEVADIVADRGIEHLVVSDPAKRSLSANKLTRTMCSSATKTVHVKLVDLESRHPSWRRGVESLKLKRKTNIVTRLRLLVVILRWRVLRLLLTILKAV